MSSSSAATATTGGWSRLNSVGVIGVYSAALLGVLIWRLQCRQRARRARIAANNTTATQTSPPTTATASPSSSTSGVDSVSHVSSPTAAAGGVAPLAESSSQSFSSQDILPHKSASGTPSSTPASTSTTTSSSSRTRVRAREEVDDDEDKVGFLSNTPVFTRQSISPNGTDILEPLLRYESRGGYAEYIVGNIPIIISVPHGGYLRPAQIPERRGKDVCSTSDIFTQELARAIIQQFHQRLRGRIPHMIINRLDRSRLDANRSPEEAAQHEDASRAFEFYQNAIEHAKHVSMIGREHESIGHAAGLVIDLHGQSHDRNRIQVGYVVRAQALRLNDEQLNNDIVNGRDESSIRTLVQHWQSVRSSPVTSSSSSSSTSTTSTSSVTFSDIIRGPHSLGALFEAKGYGAVPSNIHADAGEKLYFNGGYNTRRHGSINGGAWQAIQLECNSIGIRDSREARLKFAATFVDVILQWLHIWFAPSFVPLSLDSPSSSTSSVPSPSIPSSSSS